ncbi:34-kDa subunit of RNA polymerase III (C) [Mortierella polycephala]|uniref:DNA-directed RNA polymerase III subunit RPC6 n=1 Tax=Mortierella polycephala TaxID=41804 RepID=A0A9P6TZ19_9FUNG|nr:34-kDa subunit of RNA polymerase III (C) [Mortierella polycephala]
MSQAKSLEDLFYEECTGAGANGLTSTDFLGKHPECNPRETALAMNNLLLKGFIDVFHVRGESIYKALKKEDVGKADSLQGEEQMVYNTIRSSGNEGIWTKHLKAKTNLHETVIKRCLKVLEQKALVKAIKSVKYPTRKLYMLMELTPSVEVTGGPWFTDQELDIDFVETLTNQIYKYILMKARLITIRSDIQSFRFSDRKTLMLISNSFPRDASCVYTSSHSAYPSAAQVRKYIMEKRISQVDLTVDDITMLLDVLVYDGKVERFIAQVDDDWGEDDDMDTDSDWVYKAVRDKKTESAWQDCPCGVCPVANFCTETGPVNPAGCTYYAKWLDF